MSSFVRWIYVYVRWIYVYVYRIVSEPDWFYEKKKLIFEKQKNTRSYVSSFQRSKIPINIHRWILKISCQCKSSFYSSMQFFFHQNIFLMFAQNRARRKKNAKKSIAIFLLNFFCHKPLVFVIVMWVHASTMVFPRTKKLFILMGNFHIHRGWPIERASMP